MTEIKHQKIKFALERDEDGYPPADFEWVWAKPCGTNIYEIDNIPFFAKCLAIGDKVEAVENSQGELCYKSHCGYSKHSTLRVIVFDSKNVPDLRKALGMLGCLSELSHLPRLIAVDLPQQVNITEVRRMLDIGQSQGLWEVEEACVWD